MADIPHLAFPFHLHRGPSHSYPEMATGSVSVVEQDSPEHVESCENVILRCPVGWRIERPDFGIPWPEYATDVDENAVLAALQAQEDRSNLTARQVRDLVGDIIIEITSEA